MKKELIISVMFFVSLFIQAQQAPLKMTFNAKGDFKIAQFTDMHLGHDMEKDMIVSDMIKGVLDSEKPDMVIFTGDNTTMDEVQQAWDEIAKEMSKRKMPWTAILGNHDDEHAVSRKEIIEIIRQEPYCLMKNIEQGIKGEGNHIIPVYSSNSSKQKPEALLYCFDTNAYSKIKAVKGYDWLGLSQVNWYVRESRNYTTQNDGKPLPALAFIHIPLPEYTQAWESLETKRYGERNEKECSPNLNSGMFTNMLECGDVMGMFAGHDHVND